MLIKMDEKIYYNAVNIALSSDYRKLGKLIEKSGCWEIVWENLSSPEKIKINPEKLWEKLLKSKIELTLINEKKYPSLLREISFPPFGIYSIGNLSALNQKYKISIVGTRKATEQGKEIAQEFARSLGRNNFAVIGGLALGIDAAAHSGALDASAPTIAVLANGLDHFYPSYNSKLAEKIISSNGLIISEYPMGSPTLPYRFIERNRIISGLSAGTLVIEAPEGSGSLATARFALDQNREVFVTPGPLKHSNFFGSHKLIRQGATLVTSPEEIIESLAPEIINGKNNPPNQLNLLNSLEEKRIYEILKTSAKPVTVDKIIELSNLNAKIINQTLTFLTIKNIISETEAGFVVL